MKRMHPGLKTNFLLAFVVVAALFPSAAVFAVQPVNPQDLSELAGTWIYNALSSGTDSRWSRGTITVQDDGSFTLSGTDVNADNIGYSGSFSVNSNWLAMVSPASSNSVCQVDMGKTLLVCTQTEADNAVSLIVAAKEGLDSFSQADLTGTWEFNGLSSGEQNQWLRSTLTVKEDGTFIEQQSNSSGAKKTETGTLSISPSDGEITENCPLCTDARQYTIMDSGKAFLVTTSTDGSGAPQLGVFSRKGGPFSLTDLAGIWQMSSLASADAPVWKDAEVTILPNGTFTLLGTESDGSTLNSSGRLSISPEGVVTCPSCRESSFRMVMGSGKTSIVGTDTPGLNTYQMSILTRNPSSVSGTVNTPDGIPLTGVTVTLTGGSGTLPSSVTTDASGTYSFGGLINGRYKVTPSLAGVMFSPENESIAVLGQDVTQDFTGAPVTISGKVLPYKGPHETVGQQGITVNLSLNGSVVKTYATDVEGNFLFLGLGNGLYTVTPVPPDHTGSSEALGFAAKQVNITLTGKNAKPFDFKYKTDSTCSKCH